MGNFCFFGCGPPPGPPPTPSPTPAPTPFPTSAPVGGGGGGGGGGSAFDPAVQGVQPNCFINDPTRFNICLDLDLASNDSLQAFQDARNQWQTVLTGQENNRGNFRNFLRSFGRQGQEYASNINQIPDFLDDIYIAAFERSIDGVNGVLGFAGPDFVYPDTGRTMTGSMVFDSADVRRLGSAAFANTVLHEMGHVLGIGTLVSILSSNKQAVSKIRSANFASFVFLLYQWESTGVVSRFQQNGRTQYTYNGSSANREWSRICDGPLPIETDGGEGTAGGHWDEDCLRTELMTGFLDGGNDPLSVITVASLEDLGYSVSKENAEPFTSRDVAGFCCNRRRNLRKDDDEDGEFMQVEMPALDSDTVQMAAEEAFTVMQTMRSEMPAEMPEGAVYVGGESMTVFVFDSEGNVRDLAFRWEDLKEMF